jgi:hypothetical protein
MSYFELFPGAVALCGFGGVDSMRRKTSSGTGLGLSVGSGLVMGGLSAREKPMRR